MQRRKAVGTAPVMITDEQAKAVQETAKATGTFAELFKRVGGFVAKVIGPACYEAGGILTDYTRYYRYKNLLAISDKVDAIHARRNSKGMGSTIPPRVAIPILESASLEDDDTLQNVWAKLIANGTDPNFKAILHPGYIEIIKQLTPDEAVILNSFAKFRSFPIIFLYDVPEEYQVEDNVFTLTGRIKNPQRAVYQAFYELFNAHCTALKLKKIGDARLYLDNLLRLRIVEVGHTFTGKDSRHVTPPWSYRPPKDKSRSISIPARQEFLRMTSFGQSFISACFDENDSAELK